MKKKLSAANGGIISNNSTQISATIPEDESFHYGNASSSALAGTTGMAWQQQNPEHQGIFLDSSTDQTPFPGLMSSAQEASTVSISESNSAVSWSANGNVEDSGINLQNFGFDSPYQQLVNEFGFQTPTSHEVARDLCDYPLI